MGRISVSGGVTPLGSDRIQFDFRVDGVRYRPSLSWVPHETNLRRARQFLANVKARIEAGNFRFNEFFPDFACSSRVPLPLSGRTCNDVFDSFLEHEAARVARDDLSPSTLASHRQLLDHCWRPAIGALSILAVRYTQLVKIADSHRWSKKTYNNAISALRRAFAFGFGDHPELYNSARALKSARIGRKDRPKIDPFSIQDAEVLIAAIHEDWGEAQGNYDEFRFFTGLRPSEQIALVVNDYDTVNGVLSVTKARVSGIDRDRTKINEDRRIVLCARARAVLERQLALREQLVRQGRIRHQQLFFAANGDPIRRLYGVHRRWQHTLRRLAIRYRRPYTARHTSVSWNLMIGRHPLLVAKEHGHRILTMLTVYAAWTGESTETDIRSIRRARRAPAAAARLEAVMGRKGKANWAMDWPTEARQSSQIASRDRHLDWRSGRDSKSLLKNRATLRASENLPEQMLR